MSCNQIEKLTESLNQVTTANGKITSELVIIRNVNINLENRIINLEKLEAKAEQYNGRNNIEMSGILNKICHCLPSGRNSTTDNKCVVLKFVNRKHSEPILRSKKSISSKS